jgi:hypothetical protein
MNTTFRALIAAGVVVASFGLAVAKLPPLTDEQKAAAAAKKEKDAEVAQKDAADLAKAQDRAASKYIAEQRAKGKTVTPQMVALRRRPRPQRRTRQRSKHIHHLTNGATAPFFIAPAAPRGLRRRSARPLSRRLTPAPISPIL